MNSPSGLSPDGHAVHLVNAAFMPRCVCLARVAPKSRRDI